LGWTTAAELEAALAEAGRSLGTRRRDIQGQRVVELAAWELAIPLAHALLDDAAPSLDAWLTDAHAQLEPLIEAVNAATRRPRTALWRGTRDRFAGAVVWIAQTTGREDRAAELAHQLVANAEVRPFNGGILHVREGCCLYYRIPGTIKCWGCPLLTDDDRRALTA
jgi:hypothetical protein